MNKDERKSLARKNGNENTIWSWNDSTAHTQNFNISIWFFLMTRSSLWQLWLIPTRKIMMRKWGILGRYYPLYMKILLIIPTIYYISIKYPAQKNDVGDDELLEITKETSKTKPFKSYSSSFWNTTELIKVECFHQLIPRLWQILWQQILVVLPK